MVKKLKKMSIQKALLIELEREKDNTMRMLKVLPDEHFSWKPHVKSYTLGELANHIVELHNWVTAVIEKDELNFYTDYKRSELPNAEALIQTLEKGYEANKAALENLEEANYFGTWTLRAGDHVLVSLPKAGAIRFIVNNHLIHHRGQLSVYLRLLDVPVPGIYGPSADEK